MMKVLSILGSTGSIGSNALTVVEEFDDKFEIAYLVCATASEPLLDQIDRFHPRAVALLDSDAASQVKNSVSGKGVEVLSGREGVLDIAARDDVDMMVNALVGSAGMEPTVMALEAGVDVALSNKESLVMAGHLINRIKNESGAEIVPVDSEHSAIWQCIAGEDAGSVERLILTGSGGPFRTRPMETFPEIGVEEALKHPNWKMGRKITIDSATMMNKGLEVIEAHWLFGLEEEMIDIVIHPESIIHSMVEFVDGSIKAQLGIPDMKIPIQYALTYPHRYPADWEEIDFTAISPLTFEQPDLEKFPSIQIAYDALRKGGSAPAALNVSNDHTVRAFLNGQISFDQIPDINGMAVEEHQWTEYPDLDYLRKLEVWGGNFVEKHAGERVFN